MVYFRRCQPCMTRSSLMLQDQGLTSTDLPKAIVFHEVLGAAMAIGFWSVSGLRGVGHSVKSFAVWWRSNISLTECCAATTSSSWVRRSILWSHSHATLQACYTVQPSRTVFRPLAQRASNNAVARKSYDAAVHSAQRTMTRLPWLQKVCAPGA